MTQRGLRPSGRAGTVQCRDVGDDIDGNVRPLHTHSSSRETMRYMVDCFDRIAVQMTEIALEPVRMLRERSLLTAVTLRTPSNGRRFNITIEKRFPDGPENTPAYHWMLVEVDISGAVIPEGVRAESPIDVPYRQPEDAYWGAIDALCDAQRSTADPA